MKIVLFVALFGPALVLAQGGDTDCPGVYTGNNCYSMAKKGWVGDNLGYHWIRDGPCFTDEHELVNGGEPSCFVTDGNMQDKCDCTKPACNCGSAVPSSTPESECSTSRGVGSKCYTKEQKGSVVSNWGYTYTSPEGPCFTDNTVYDGFPTCITTEDNLLTRCNCDEPKCGCTKVYDLRCPSAVSGMGEFCGNHVCRRGGITQSEKDEIVDTHNELRNIVYSGEGVGSGGVKLPEASPMPEDQMIWDEDLAYSAQKWADHCINGHDDDWHRRYYSQKYDTIGQNVASYWTKAYDPKIKFKDMIRFWYDEIKDVTETMIMRYHETDYPVTEHFTQLAWAASVSVGCGVTSFAEDGGNGLVVYLQILVCNYHPAGNYIGQPVYPTEGQWVGEEGSEEGGGILGSNE